MGLGLGGLGFGTGLDNIKIGSNKNTTLTNVVQEKDRDVKETVERTKEVNIKKKKTRDPLKEATNFNIKKKDALGKSYYVSNSFCVHRFPNAFVDFSYTQSEGREYFKDWAWW